MRTSFACFYTYMMWQFQVKWSSVLRTEIMSFKSQISQKSADVFIVIAIDPRSCQTTSHRGLLGHSSLNLNHGALILFHVVIHRDTVNSSSISLVCLVKFGCCSYQYGLLCGNIGFLFCISVTEFLDLTGIFYSAVI